jgi:hypothetical protein
MPVLAPNTRILAEFSDYPGLLNAVRSRVNELAINGERFDEYAGLPRGYLSKLIGAHPIRSLGRISMGPVFGALGIRCIIVEDPIATTRLKSRLTPRNNSFMRPSRTLQTVTDRQWRRIRKLGSEARWKKIPKAQRRRIMRQLAIMRWSR